ncbi:MAG: hypothetical protein QOH93_3686 [Chloroflexia bacterium]|nr:hypothetical protein [Chloroflexia bacterium]
MTDALEECHIRLGKLIGPGAEPIEVMRCAEEHRAYWRPERVRVVLLAESHVYTTAEELQRRVVLPDGFQENIPGGFVRLVYCLGYGENRLLDQPIIFPKNLGTPQFWKIFYSCLNKVGTNEDFASIQGEVPFLVRIRNKLALLRRLRDSGVWLVDTSLAALYLPGQPKPAPALLEACLRTSWDTYVGSVVKAAGPAHVVCIGKGVAQSLGNRLNEVGAPVTVVPQPNAHLTAAEHFQVFQTYYQVVQQALAYQS